MLVYSPLQTARWQYILHVLMKDILQVDYQLTQNIEDYKKYNGIKWAYSNNPNLDGIVFKMYPLLSENNIENQDITVKKWKNYNLFFAVDENPFFTIDPFAVSFYLISRYEEYVFRDNNDEHERFRVENSIAYQYKFHREPIVNMLAVEIAKIIKQTFPQFQWKLPTISRIYTCDVDIAYKYKGKGFFISSFNVLKSLFSVNFKEVKNYFFSICSNNFIDPFEIRENKIEELKKEYQKIIFFLPVSKYGKYDKNIRSNSRLFHSLIRKLQSMAEIGLHPSYRTYKNENLLKKEKKRLEKIANQTIYCSRQHYLRLSFPESYQNLIKNKITDDYTLGWSNEVGFRASISVPFYFFDLTTESITNLKIHSLTMMDVALYRITKSKQEYENLIILMKNTVKAWGGEFVILEHNSSQFTFS